MAALDDLTSLTVDANANQRIRQLVLRLGIFIGLEFEERQWGKRPVRRLRRGVIAFGEDNLPVPIHGRNRVCLPASGVEGGSVRDDANVLDHTQPAPACCRGPSADAVPRRGARGRKGRTDESNSGLEQTHQGTNAGRQDLNL